MGRTSLIPYLLLRLFAFFIDCLAVAPFLVVSDQVVSGKLQIIPATLVSGLYYLICYLLMHQSLGQQFWGLTIRTVEGTVPDRSQLARRALLKELSLLLLGIPLVPLFKRRSLLDLVCRTKVVYS